MGNQIVPHLQLVFKWRRHRQWTRIPALGVSRKCLVMGLEESFCLKFSLKVCHYIYKGNIFNPEKSQVEDTPIKDFSRPDSELSSPSFNSSESDVDLEALANIGLPPQKPADPHPHQLLTEFQSPYRNGLVILSFSGEIQLFFTN